MSSVICQDCKAELSGTPKFCPKCGSRVESPIASILTVKHCPRCGTENPIGARFCKRDGYLFEDKNAVTPLAANTVPKTAISDAVPTDLPAETAVGAAQSTQKMTLPQHEAAARQPIATSAKPSPAVHDFGGSPPSASRDTTESTRVDIPNRASKNYTTRLLFGIPSVLVVIAASMGGYKYWSERQAGHKLPAADVNNHQTASAPAHQQDAKPAVPDAIPSNFIPQTAAAQVNAEKIQVELNRLLENKGIGGIDASVNSDGSVNLNGAVSSRKARDEVVRLTLSQYGVERVDEAGLQVVSTAKPIYSPPRSPSIAQHRPPPSSPAPPMRMPDPSRLERDINRLLHGGG